MLERLNRLGWDKLSGVGLVLLLHGTLLYGAWSYRLIPAPDAAVTLFVDLINPPLPPKKEEPPRPPLPRQVKLVKPHPVELPRP